MAAPHSPEFYRERSHRFLNLVDSMLALGEPEAACEMVWGAAAHAIKAAAQRQGWRHSSHALLRVAVNRLVDEIGAPPHILGRYYLASNLHAGFYGDRIFSAAHIRRAKDPVAEFIRTLENLP